MYIPYLPFSFCIRKNDKRKLKCYKPFFVFHSIKSNKKRKTISHTVYRLSYDKTKQEISVIFRKNILIVFHTPIKICRLYCKLFTVLKPENKKRGALRLIPGRKLRPFSHTFVNFETKLPYPVWQPDKHVSL